VDLNAERFEPIEKCERLGNPQEIGMRHYFAGRPLPCPGTVYVTRSSMAPSFRASSPVIEEYALSRATLPRATSDKSKSHDCQDLFLTSVMTGFTARDLSVILTFQMSNAQRHSTAEAIDASFKGYRMVIWCCNSLTRHRMLLRNFKRRRSEGPGFIWSGADR